MESTSSFGYWIRRQRKALDLTQQALAERVGCSVAAIKKIEGDERKPSRQIAERIADALGMPASQRDMFLEVARGLRPVDQLLLANEPAVSTAKLPTGTVTFLFTDIEDSTKLAQQYSDAMPALLTRHHEILHQSIQAHNGYVFQLVGDSFAVAFHSASDALKAALNAQHLLQTEVWSPTTIKVRMGIHTGTAQLQNVSKAFRYSGYATIALTQRIMSAAHGKQILLSQITHDLIGDQLPADVILLDMGEHHLKGFLQPIHLYQVTASDLPANFPPLNTLDSVQHNLPVQLTSFIGRERELAEARQLFSNTRLLTLIGPGGTGKTRLALQVVQELLPVFTNGVWLVELAPLTDPSLIPQTIASVFELREAPNVLLMDILTNYLRAKQLLLILDNCEHVIAACAKLSADLLRVCPQLKIIASSREALGVSGETIYRVPSLSLPDPAQVKHEAIQDSEAIQLFVERAMAVQSHFALTDSNASAVIQICHRLDGIPLALELAAARLGVFSPAEIASRLDDRFRLLIGGSRTALERHQTLRALIDWSYDLLSDEERRLFFRLSVFAGGWTFEAAVAIFTDLDVLNLLTQLANKSLVMVDADAGMGGTRYRLPETIRQYARDKLLESGEAENIRDRHLDFFLQFAEAVEPKLRSAEQLEWLDRLETEHDNLRTALAWSLESGKSDSALQLAGALYYFWELRGYFSEGQRWLDEALALSEREHNERVSVGETYTHIRSATARRAKALYAAGRFRLATTMIPRVSRAMVEKSLQLWRELGDKWWIAVTLEHIGFMLSVEGDIETSRIRLEEGVSLAREVEDRWALSMCLVRLAFSQADDAAARRRICEEGVAVARSVGDKSVLSQGLIALVTTHLAEGSYTAAAAVAEEALAEARVIGSITQIFLALFQLVIISCLQGDLAKAKGYCFDVLALRRNTGIPMGNGFTLFDFAVVAIFSGEPGKGVRLLAAMEAWGRQSGIKMITYGFFLSIITQALERARSQLDPAAFEAAWAEGQQMTMDQALALATEHEGGESPLPHEGLGLSSQR